MEKEKNDFTIHPIPVLIDNIIWILAKGNQAVVVDPAISEPVVSWLKAKRLELISVLQTHHHEDHIGGTEGLLKVWPSASVIAAKSDFKRIPFQTRSVMDQESLTLLGKEVKVLAVPGHTKYHIAYYFKSCKKSRELPMIFCGDTLFGGGCGKLFEGTPKEMFNSLNIINSLPEQTQIYCAHEYTEDNLRWAISIYPKDKDIKDRLEKVVHLRSKGNLTIPSTILEERKTNLFLRARNSNDFADLRFDKDNWKK